MSYVVPDFHMPGVLSWDERLTNIKHCISLGLPLLEEQPKKEGHLTVACYGPTLSATFRDISGPFMTVSGAHDYLISLGKTPDYHLETDPRPHKAGMLKLANDKTHYLVSSVCHPEVFKALEGRKVSIWHLGNGPESEAWHRANTPGLLIAGGSTAGLRAIELAHALGYRALEFHGMDACFSPSGQWAGPHTGKPKTEFMVKSGNRYFRTSSLMVQQAREFIHFWQTHDIKIRVKGDGLIRQMMKESEKQAQQNRRAA